MFDDLLIEKKTAIVISWLNYMLEKMKNIKESFQIYTKFHVCDNK